MQPTTTATQDDKKSVNILTKHNLCCANFAFGVRFFEGVEHQERGIRKTGRFCIVQVWRKDIDLPANSSTCCKRCEIYESSVSSPFFASWILFPGFTALHFHPRVKEELEGARRRSQLEKAEIKGLLNVKANAHEQQ